MAIVRKDKRELEKMHRAGLLVWGALQELRKLVRPGVSTKDLDSFAERYTAEHDARPAFKGYMGYPGSLCTSINQEVVHGIPSLKRVLKEGDILSMDFGVELDGYYGDAALTVPVGKIAPEREKLLRVTRESLDQAIEKVRPGNRLSDISAAVQGWVEKNGFRWCGNSWATASAPRCTKSRSFRITASQDKARDCSRAWCWPSSRW
jgi:methionyl aminopeptidase